MKNIILYFPYLLLANPKSGSGVRPQKIIQAFTDFCKTRDLELIIVSGESKERFEQLDSLIASRKIQDTELCYIENHTMPYWFTDKDHRPKSFSKDYRFWKYLKKSGVPVGLFYRDIHWKFDDLYVLKGKKRLLTPIMKMMYRLELSLFSRFLDTLFLPSTEMNEYVNWQGTMTTLPPAMSSFANDEVKLNDASIKNAIYVGGISERYGTKMLLKAFSLLNKEKHTVSLHLVCRKEEYDASSYFQGYEKAEWLNVYHLSGKELDAVYAKADIALVPLEDTAYQNFAIPVKLFEYLSYRLPIVSTNCTALAKIINEENVGIVTEYDPQKYADGIVKMLQKDVHSRYSANISEELFKKHSWLSRVEKIVHTLKT